MTSVSNRKVFIYSSFFIALLLNVPKLFALNKTGLVAHFWQFDLTELLLQTLLNLLFCICIFFYSITNFKKLFARDHFSFKAKYIIINLLLLVVFAAVGLVLQRALFKQGFLPGGGVVLRLVFSFILIFIELRIIHLLEESKEKELENEHLRNENLKAGMELLKARLNPHFFFNALSSLSAIVRENPPKAQVYINHLSKVFRYSLQNTENNLVPLKKELDAVMSYAQLMKMRYESGLEIEIDIEEYKHNTIHLPHMSLQPLVENAVKHNTISIAKPLTITISLKDDYIVISNNLQPLSFPEHGENSGLANLNDRYLILLKRRIEIVKTGDTFTVKLPLK